MTWTLLHDACEGHRVDEICRLSKEFPQDVLRTDDHGLNPLHILCSNAHADPKAIESLLGVCPQAASDQDYHGNTPLHIACTCRNADDHRHKHLIRLLVDAYPAAVSTTNREGLTPIHMACRYAPDLVSVIGVLIDAYPYALRTRIKMGTPSPKPRRKEALLGHDMDRCHAMFEANALMPVKDTVGLRYLGASEQIRDGAYPLHMAVQANACLDTLEILIKAEPDVLYKTNKFGETPLHLIMKRSTTENTTAKDDGTTSDDIDKEEDEAKKLLVLRCGTEALHCVDNDGNTPMHVAAMFGACSMHVAKMMLDTWPEGIHASNNHGLTPIDLARQYKKCEDDVMLLFAMSDE